MKVSVIVPVYNAEKYLVKCLDSLCNQTLEDLEIVLVNDGSTDNSLAILNDYKTRYPEKIKIFSKENGGQGMARNIAIQHATGKYLGFVDSDDYADVTMFEKMLNVAEQGDYDVVFCEHYEVRGENLLHKTFKDYNSEREMFVDALVSPWIKLIKKETYVNSKVIFPEGYIYEDTSWFAALLPSIKKYTVIHQPLVFHAINENSTMTKRQEERTASIFPVMEYAWNYFNDNGFFQDYKLELEYFFTRIMFMSSFERISKIKDKKLKKQLFARSYALVKERFPKYKKNPYLKGAKKLYIKLLNKFTAPLFMWIISRKGK